MEKFQSGINCIKCGKPVLGSYCLNCGIIDRKNSLNEKIESSSLLNPNMSSITSLFQPADNSIASNAKKQRTKKGNMVKVFFLIFLSILWIGILAGGFWYANKTPKIWTSPVILGAKTAQKGEFNSVEIKSNIKTIDFDPKLSEGSLDSINYAKFASADENLFIELFGLSKYINNFLEKKIVDDAKKSFDFKDDDIDVYFENKFSMIFQDDLKNWGLITVTKNKKFVDEKIVLLDKYKALKVKPKGAVYDYSKVTTKLIKYKDDKYYFLVGSSKEFLDRMVELSEGNLPNLEKSALYSASDDKAAGIALARVFVSTKSKPAWTAYVEWFSAHFSYSGLSKILLTSDFNNMILRKAASGVQIEIVD